MPNRVRLTWNRNQDAETQYYRVFRDEQPNISHQLSLDSIIMKVAHPRNINPITIQHELLIRETDQVYRLHHKNILLTLNEHIYPFALMVDGVRYDDFGLDLREGKIVFDTPILRTSVVMAETYTFDGVAVWDYEITEPGKTYYGPEAKDSVQPESPKNISIEQEHERNRVVLRWDAASPKGKIYYYRIDAAINEQKYSKLSDLRNVFLQEPMADRPYLIERSDDGRRWVEIARVKANVFYEYNIDREAPAAITGLLGEFFPYRNRGDAQVTLTWNKVSDNILSRTSMYRVRAQNRVGATSDPSAIVGPLQFKTSLSHVLIRRKIFDGSLPSYDGSDAVTVAQMNDLSTVTFFEDVPDNNYYVYGLWVVDKAGNHSAIASTSILIGDATAPGAPVNLSVEEFHCLVG